VAQVTAMTPVAKAVGYNRIVQARGHRLSVGRCRAPGQRRKGFAPEKSPTSLGRPGYRGLDDALNEIRGVALYEGVGTYSRGVAIAPTPIAGRGSMDVGSPSEREIDVKDGSHCLIELVRALV